MAFQLVRLDEDSLYEHIFERYVELERHTATLKQDLGIQQRDASTLEIDIEPPEPSDEVVRVKKSGRRRRKGDRPAEDEGARTYDERYSVVVEQSLSNLNSSVSNNNSTTGYVLWSSTPFFLRWLLYSAEAQPFRNGNVAVEVEGASEDTIIVPGMYSGAQGDVGILELGTGISPLLASVLCNHVSGYVCTDQRGILNKLKQNLRENVSQITRRRCVSASLDIENEPEGAILEELEEPSRARRKPTVRLEVQELDWEKFSADVPHPYLDQLATECETVYILAMDVIYNEYLIGPFLRTLSALRDLFGKKQTRVRCLVGVHLRSQDIATRFLEQAVVEYELPVHSIRGAAIDQSRYALYLVN